MMIFGLFSQWEIHSPKEVQTSIQWVKDHKAALEGWDMMG